MNAHTKQTVLRILISIYLCISATWWHPCRKYSQKTFTLGSTCIEMKKTITTLLLVASVVATATAQKYKVSIETDYGGIVMVLYDSTPKNTENMVKLAKEHYYDSTLFHRCIPSFVIQGGDSTSKHAPAGKQLGDGGLGYTVPAEFNQKYFHKRGALGVARDQTPDKSGSACQFYIVVGKKVTDVELDNVEKRIGRTFTPEQREMYKTKGGVPHLDGNYTVFGEVIEGMDVVDKIANEPRDRNDRPNKDIRMWKVRLVKKKKRFLLF
jgi:cyclophilin family peptidyl-prolyl cis-trans isomerase